MKIISYGSAWMAPKILTDEPSLSVWKNISNLTLNKMLKVISLTKSHKSVNLFICKIYQKIFGEKYSYIFWCTSFPKTILILSAYQRFENTRSKAELVSKHRNGCAGNFLEFVLHLFHKKLWVRTLCHRWVVATTLESADSSHVAWWSVRVQLITLLRSCCCVEGRTLCWLLGQTGDDFLPPVIDSRWTCYSALIRMLRQDERDSMLCSTTIIHGKYELNINTITHEYVCIVDMDTNHISF